MTGAETQRVTLVIPIPDSHTGGNARGHWATVYRARRDTLVNAYYAVVQEGCLMALWSPVDIVIDWYGWNRVDRDNALSRVKPAIDGLVEAGLIPDDSPQHIQGITVRHVEIDRKEPRVELTITAITGSADRRCSEGAGGERNEP